MHYCKLYILAIFLLLAKTMQAQFNVVKYVPAINNDITRLQPFKFHLNSYGIGYERCITDHSSLELIVFRARMVTLTPAERETKVLDGFGAELRFRHYFQTHEEYLTYAPFEFYWAPTVSYLKMQTPYLKGLHELSNFALGGLVGFQLVMELFQEGFTVDVNTGFNVNLYNTNGFSHEVNMYRITPRVGLQFGYTF